MSARFLAAAACLAAVGAGAVAPAAASARVGAVLSAAVPAVPVPAINADIPDPSLVDTGNGWLLFSTGYANIGVYSSPDLHSWSHLPDAFASFAPWISSDGRFWAPGVTQLDGRWLMYYTAHDRRSGLQCIGVATSANARGPYSDTSTTPLVCQTSIGGSIDPDPFVDDDGSAYLLWKNDGNCCGSPTQLWSQRLNGDGLSLSGNPVSVLTASARWEQGIIEAPSMVRTKAGVVLVYTGGPYASPEYAVGTANCASPLGPCRRASTKSFLGTTAWWAGPGSADVARRADGHLFLALHAWAPAHVGYVAGGRRALYVFSLTFDGTSPRLADVDGNPVPTPRDSLAIAIAGTPDGRGLFDLRDDGMVSAVGAVSAVGGVETMALHAPAVAIASTASGLGYWIAATDGGVFSFGDATFYGSMGGHPLVGPVVAITPTLTGHGYWLAASDGGVFSFGDAAFYGSMGGHPLNQPIVAIIGTASGHGYWLVASDGGVFSFGDAVFYGSMGGHPLNAPIAAAAAGPDGAGYWLIAYDGGVFSFGSAPFAGSLGGGGIDDAIGIAPDQTHTGYWLVTAERVLYAFGAAPPLG